MSQQHPTPDDNTAAIVTTDTGAVQVVAAPTGNNNNVHVYINSRPSMREPSNGGASNLDAQLSPQTQASQVRAVLSMKCVAIILIAGKDHFFCTRHATMKLSLPGTRYLEYTYTCINTGTGTGTRCTQGGI